MSLPNRREMLGSLGGMVAAGGWLALNAAETQAQDSGGTGDAPREYGLPPLPYPPDALEPHLDAATMLLHHDKHHAAYVAGLNAALAGLSAVRRSGAPEDQARLRDLTDALAFNGSGHSLHCIFWPNLRKGGGSEPQGELARYIQRDFGTFAAFRAQFSTTALKVQGSGWGILAWEPLSRRLIVLGAEKHQNQTVYGCAPLLVLDVWEHAYYLKYRNDRAAYVQAFWNVIDWDNVAERLAAARRITT